jgi:peptide deformylase
MSETMQKEDGVGLAAPQIGESKRIIVVNLCSSRSQKEQNKPLVFINPKIIKKSKQTEIDEEGCLSVPGVFLKIKRAKRVEVFTKDLEGNELEIKAEGLSARILQHEIDHLDGILFFERLPFLEKLSLKKKLKAK